MAAATSDASSVCSLIVLQEIEIGVDKVWIAETGGQSITK